MVEFLADSGMGDASIHFPFESPRNTVSSDAQTTSGMVSTKWPFPHSKQHGKFKNKRAG